MTLPALLWRLARFQWRGYLLTVGFSVLGAALLLVPGLIARDYFTVLTAPGPHRLGIDQLALLLVLAEFGRLLVQLMATASSITASLAAKALVRRNLFAHILAKPVGLGLPASSGEAVSRFRDDIDLIEFVLSSSALNAGPFLYTLVAVGIMLRINVAMTAGILLPLTVIGVAARLARSQLAACRRATRAATAQVTGVIGEIFGAVQAIKVASAEAPVVARIAALGAERRTAQVREQVVSEVFNAIASDTVTIGTGIVLLVAGQAIRAGSVTVGDFALFSYFLGSITAIVPAVATTLTSYTQAGVSLPRLTGLLDGTPDTLLVQPAQIYPRPAPLPGVVPEPCHVDQLLTLEARGLTYHYPAADGTARRGIEEVDLRLELGSLTVITGPVGAGKTTLLRVLLGLLPAEAGTLYWNGHPIPDPATFLVPPRCAYTPQVPRLFSESLRETILLGLPETEAVVAEALRLAMLEADVAALEQGLATPVGPRGVRLSGGQVQRTAAARMFVTRSQLLVVDDLSSALDVETERALWDRLPEYGVVTVLAVSHRRPVLERADQLIVMTEGRVRDVGTLGDLLDRCEAMQRLWMGLPDASAINPSCSGLQADGKER